MSNNIDNDIFSQLGISSQPKTSKNDRLGQDEFLTLMITQLRNQDPFKPMENGDFIGQIAQFGTVSGIEDLQNSFSTLANSLTSNQALQASMLVGRSVSIPSDVGVLSQEQPFTGSIELPQSSTQVAVEIVDGAGQLVRQINLGSQTQGSVPFNWDGRMSNGELAPLGAYRVRGLAVFGQDTAALNTFINDRVDSVTLGNGSEGLVLNLAGAGAIPFSEVRQVR